MDVNHLVMVKLTRDHDLSSFDCHKKDLNDFLRDDALPHQEQLMAATYLFTHKNDIVGFLSLQNDMISEMLFDDKTEFNRFRKILPNSKRYRTLPAVKIGRLGVHKNFKRRGVGSHLLDTVKYSFTFNNKTGCRFITIDAYNDDDSLGLYTSNEFEFFTKLDKKERTRAMYFDLIRFKNATPASFIPA